MSTRYVHKNMHTIRTTSRTGCLSVGDSRMGYWVLNCCRTIARLHSPCTVISANGAKAVLAAGTVDWHQNSQIWRQQGPALLSLLAGGPLRKPGGPMCSCCAEGHRRPMLAPANPTPQRLTQSELPASSSPCCPSSLHHLPIHSPPNHAPCSSLMLLCPTPQPLALGLRI